ncbi:hypothetical protein B0H10DRAFT_908398 [Mycena sp. CBHHK59/15]|nr:hypothetical protein B0H10DRAFT_908398 [Mycena sp. CBHHK59/15]
MRLTRRARERESERRRELSVTPRGPRARCPRHHPPRIRAPAPSPRPLPAPARRRAAFLDISDVAPSDVLLAITAHMPGAVTTMAGLACASLVAMWEKEGRALLSDTPMVLKEGRVERGRDCGGAGAYWCGGGGAPTRRRRRPRVHRRRRAHHPHPHHRRGARPANGLPPHPHRAEPPQRRHKNDPLSVLDCVAPAPPLPSIASALVTT